MNLSGPFTKLSGTAYFTSILRSAHHIHIRPRPALYHSSLSASTINNNMGSIDKIQTTTAATEPKFNVKSIAIIGAGPSGLAAAKYLRAQNAFDHIVVFEQQAQVGGVWNYSAQPSDILHIPQTSPFCPPDPPLSKHEGKETKGVELIFPSPMYERLNTNIPHTLMRYSDLGFLDVDENSKIFPSRETVQAYLERYAVDVREIIQFQTRVEEVRLLEGGEDDRWEVRTTDLATGDEKTDVYDAVVVASGHYSAMYVPDIEGIQEFNERHPGIISHSKLYRTPETYRSKKTMVVGNAASGLDISSQIKQFCQQPLLVSVRDKTADEVREYYGFEETAEIERFLPDERGVRLKDGRTITDLDAVLFCTGYVFTFPFLKSMEPPLAWSGRRVHELYKHVISIDHPTLVFPGLPIKVIPFPVAEAQAAVYARVWANELALPSRTEMLKWEREEEVRKGKKFHVFPKGGDGAYINEMHDWALRAESRGKEPPRWDNEALWQRGLYAEAKLAFERQGKKAVTLDELGFRYEPPEKALKKDPGFDVAA